MWNEKIMQIQCVYKWLTQLTPVLLIINCYFYENYLEITILGQLLLVL